jgi:hypothetical protein
LRCGLLNQTQPLMLKLTRLLSASKGGRGEDDDIQSPMKGPSSVQPTPPQPQNAPQQDPAIISFIPTTVDRSPLPVLERPSKDLDDSSPLKNRPQTSASSDEISIDGEGKRGACWLLDYNQHQQDEHILLDSPAEITVHERFLIHLPIEQVCKSNISAFNWVILDRREPRRLQSTSHCLVRHF